MTCACAIAGFVLLNLAVIAACFLGALNLDLFIFLFFLASKLLVPFAENLILQRRLSETVLFANLRTQKLATSFSSLYCSLCLLLNAHLQRSLILWGSPQQRPRCHFVIFIVSIEGFVYVGPVQFPTRRQGPGPLVTNAKSLPFVLFCLVYFSSYFMITTVF